MTLRIGCFANHAKQQSVKPDDHSEVVPLLPIPNRTVKRLSADDSAGSRVKVGHRQATIKNPPQVILRGVLLWGQRIIAGSGRNGVWWVNLKSPEMDAGCPTKIRRLNFVAS